MTVSIHEGSRRASRRVAVVTIVAGVVAVLLIARFLLPLAATLIVAAAIHYIFAPVLACLERRRVPRIVSTLAVVLVVGAVFVLTLTALLPRLYAEVEKLVAEVPARAEAVEQWLVERGLTGAEADPRARSALDSLIARAGELTGSGVRRVLGAVPVAFGAAISGLLGLIVGIYLLLGGASLAKGLAGWIPPEHRERWTRFGRDASRVLGGYVRARVLASIFIGACYWIAFSLLGLNEALLLAAIGGALNLVPVIGPLLAAVPALAVAAFQGWGMVLGVCAVQLVAQQIESNVLEPQLAGRFVHLPPAVIVLVVAAGSAIAGVPGMIIAVPLTAVARTALQIFYRETWEER